MATPTTTAQLIREDRSTIMQAITPAQLSGVAFAEFERSEDFREWSESNPAACLRRFQIRDLATYEQPAISDGRIEAQSTQFQITVAYPRDSRFGKSGDSSLEDAIRADHLKILHNLGIVAQGSYPSGCELFQLVEYEIDRDDDSAWFLVATYDVAFRVVVDFVFDSGPLTMTTAAATVSATASVAAMIRGAIMGATASVSVTAGVPDFVQVSAARSWVTGRDFFGSAFATDEWLIGNTTYSSGYAPNVGTETLVDNGSGGLTGSTSTNVVTGGAACIAWDSVDTGDRLESNGTTAGDFNALTQDFAFRMVFEVIGGSLPNSEYLLTKFNTSTGGWRIYSSGGEWHFGLWDNSGNTAGVNAANAAGGTYEDGDTHYMTGWFDSSTSTLYTKGDLSTEESASAAAIVDSTATTAALHVNGYASTTGLAGLKCISVSVCVGANAQSLYDESFWNHPP